MESPKSNSPKADKNRKPHEGRRHTNAKFYTSSSWRGLRKKYIARLEIEQTAQILLEANVGDQMYLISKIPICETCLRLYLADAYREVSSGHELDHIHPINPDNALDTEGKRYGQPLDENNLQFLCSRHHAKKSQREKKKK